MRKRKEGERREERRKRGREEGREGVVRRECGIIYIHTYVTELLVMTKEFTSPVEVHTAFTICRKAIEVKEGRRRSGGRRKEGGEGKEEERREEEGRRRGRRRRGEGS